MCKNIFKNIKILFIECYKEKIAVIDCLKDFVKWKLKFYLLIELDKNEKKIIKRQFSSSNT